MARAGSLEPASLPAISAASLLASRLSDLDIGDEFFPKVVSEVQQNNHPGPGEIHFHFLENKHISTTTF